MRAEHDNPKVSDMADPAEAVAPSCRGQNFWTVDPGLQGLLRLYLPDATVAHFARHWDRMGELGGGRLD